MKATGFFVVEMAEDYHMPLTLRCGPEYPTAGVLDWPEEGEPVAVFPTRKTARQAITRTRYYAKAFGRDHDGSGALPTAFECVIEPVRHVECEL